MYIRYASRQFVCDATKLRGRLRQRLLLRNLIARKSAFVHANDHKSELRGYRYACRIHNPALRRGFCLSRELFFFGEQRERHSSILTIRFISSNFLNSADKFISHFTFHMFIFFTSRVFTGLMET